jgi:amino acid adenylation domain-containing protein
MDPRGAPQPIGVPGELYIGGVGLARGYLRREDLTREKFVAHPFRPGARLYRSGDLVRWRGDGTLDYLGRIDDQVKLRGFRIELGEIEAALASHPDVSQALVLLDTSGSSPLLAAYVVPKGTLDGAALREHARKRLPEFMVPAEVVWLDAFPLTPNGKVDRRRLPRPRPEDRAEGAAFVAPRTAAERALAGIWERLLERRPVGASDDFFSLGGHSLLAAQVMSRVRKVFGAEIPLSAIFEHPTLEGLASVIAAREGGPELPPVVRLPPAEAGGPVHRPLSLAQERLRFLAELEGDSAAYNIPVALRLTGRLDRGALGRSLAALVERHEVLRTCFPLADGAAVARVGGADLSLGVEDLRGQGAAAPAARLAEESARPFTLSTGPVVRAHLFQVADDEHVLLVVMHHIVADGWSIGILMRELSALYAAEAGGARAELPELPIQYTDYAAWQRIWLDGHVRDQQLAYWRAALAGAPAVLDLPTDRPRPVTRTHRGGTCRVDLGREATRLLHALGRESGTTPYMALLAAFGAWLGRISGQDDLVVGSPFAGRRIAETEPLIGFFVNTLPLRVDLSGDPSFQELLERVRVQALGAHENQDVPFERLVEELHPERVLGTSPIFQVMFALQQTHAGGIDLPGLAVEPIPAQSGTAKFDLTLSLAETEDGFAGGLEYDLDLFEPSRVQSMAGQLARFVERLASQPGARISDLDLLSAEERARLVPRAPAAAPPLPAVHEAIAEQARRTPDAVAVEVRDGSLTYAALDDRAEAVAAALAARGATRDTLVGLALERSLDMMVGVLGILKAGAAYLPLDPAYPPDRLAFMLQDSGARLVLTRAGLASTFTGVETILLDVEGPQGLGGAPAGRPAPRRPSPPDALVYCLYTSGSTGQPKGVLIEHAALANHMDWMNGAMPLGPDDRVLQRTSLSFDASVWELFAPLMAGARLVLAPPDLGADTERLVRVMADRGVTVVQMVPSLLTVLVEEPGLASVTTLRRVCAGGEPLPSATVRKLLGVSGAEVWNLYGPTEATIDATAYRCRPEAVGAHGASEPIGTAIRRMEALVLDDRLRPVPDFAPGELYLAGASLGRGYLNRPELTASRFIEHSFPGGPRLRLYKTGDVVRRLPDGTLLFGGRADRQVKLRGYRIELGEVEAAVARHPAVREVAAVVRGSGGEARLVAFVVARERDRPPAAADLRPFVERELAAHMVPGQFVTVPALPHAPNGKVDYRTLGALEIAEERPVRAGGAPRDAVELELVRLFEEVLGVGDVGIQDSFFDLGGHSLLALKLKLSAEARLGRPLALVALFQNPTPAQLANVLRTGATAPSPLIPLTPAARAMLAASEGKGRRRALFLVPGGGATPFYLMPLAKRLEGVPVFGLQPRGLDGEAPPHETVEETAAWYAAAIRAVQPEGPYFLGGHSVGGHVAYEIAQQLTEEGHRIGLVALLDTLAPFPEATRPMGQDWDAAQWLVQIAAVMEGFFEVDVPLDLAALRAMPDEDRLAAFVTRLQAANILPAGARPSHVAGLLNVARAQDASGYRPRRGHHVPLAVFRAEEKGEAPHPEVGALLADDTLGWNRFTSGPVASCRVPGTHLTLVREPHVEVLARQLLPRLGS